MGGSASMITIRNKRTGETKQINEADVSQYGLTPTEIQTTQQPQFPEDKLTGIPKALVDVSQGVSDFARSIGLGFAPDLMAVSGPASAIQKATGINPLMSSAERQKFKSPRDVAMQGLRDVGGAASWMLPVGKGALLARAGYGGLQGLLQAESQPGANIQSLTSSALTGAGLNSVLPPALTKFTQGLGKYAIGKGGEMLPEVMGEVGPITGSAKYLAGTAGKPGALFTQTAPIRDEFTNLLENSKGTLNSYDVQEKATQLMNDLGFEAQPQAKSYLKMIKQGMADLTQKYLMENKGMSSRAALNYVQKDNFEIPASVGQQLLDKIRGDIKPSTWISSIMGDQSAPLQDFKKNLSGYIRGMVKDASGNPDRYDQLQAMKQGLMNMTKSLRKGADAGGAKKIASTLLNLGIAPELIASVVGGGLFAPAGMVAAGATALHDPKVATNIIANKQLIDTVLQRLGISGVSGVTGNQ